jgi:hypothetical protein
MRKIICLGAGLLLLLGGNYSSPTQASNQGKDVNKIMADKLKQSQKVLEGLAVADFKKIETSAERLIELTKTEEWLMYKSPRNELHTNEFRRSAEALIQKAKAKNIDGATLAFFDMTMTCVRCHQHVREVRDARLPDADEALRAFALERTVRP